MPANADTSKHRKDKNMTTFNFKKEVCHKSKEGRSLIQLAKSCSPWWFETIHSYDGLELSGVAEYEDENGNTYCERVSDPEEAKLWSIYGHLPEGGVECLEDFTTRQEACEFAYKLLNIFPTLRKYGLTYT